MARKARLRAQSGIYHVVMQAVRHRDLFLDAEDYQQFKSIIFKVMTDEHTADINFILYAYCLMPDHFHLLLKEQDEDVSKVVSRIATAYAHYFNNKYDLDGAIYRGRFASEPVEDNGRFNIVLRYIHQTPVRTHATSTPADYAWSSYGELIAQCRVNKESGVRSQESGVERRETRVESGEKVQSAECRVQSLAAPGDRSQESGEMVLCTLKEEYQQLSADELQRMLCSMVPATVKCLGPREAPTPRPSDKQLITLIHQLTGDTSIHELMARPYAECLKALTDLRKKGASVRQLERLTGIGRGIIQNL